MTKVSKKRYIQGFGIIVIILALVRCAFPGIVGNGNSNSNGNTGNDSTMNTKDSITGQSIASSQHIKEVTVKDGAFHPINSVPKYEEAFPDSQDVQLASAQKYGVKPVMNSEDAEKRKQELVYVGANPYFYVDRLHSSIPYLVPGAAILLNDIGRQFYDSLYVKGVPLHKIIVTSVLRTQEDVEKLRKHNHNATEHSCHMYGTTFDICYNRYKTVQDPDGPKRREVRNDTLKWVLSEVLRDMRQSGRCHIKYEKKQGCFHITVK